MWKSFSTAFTRAAQASAASVVKPNTRSHTRCLVWGTPSTSVIRLSGCDQPSGGTNDDLDDFVRCASDRMDFGFYGLSCRRRAYSSLACARLDLPDHSLCNRRTHGLRLAVSLIIRPWLGTSLLFVVLHRIREGILGKS